MGLHFRLVATILVPLVLIFSVVGKHVEILNETNKQFLEISNKIKQLSLTNSSSYLQIGRTESILIEPQELKKENSRLSIVIVMTKAENKDWRQTIRNGWALQAETLNATVLFFMSSSEASPFPELFDELEREADSYNDIIVDNLEESPLLNSVQTLRMLNWYQVNWADKSDFLIKTDDNMFVNLVFLTKHLKTLKLPTLYNGYVAGNVNAKNPPRTPNFADSNSSKFVPKDVWEDIGGLFPEYISSALVIVSQRVVPYALDVSKNINLFHLEEVYFTGMLVQWTLQIELSPIPEIYDDYALSLTPEKWWKKKNTYIYAARCFNETGLEMMSEAYIKKFKL